MMQAVGREAGISIEKARADLDLVAAGLQAEHPDVYRTPDGYRMTAIPLRGGVTRAFKPTLFVLLGTAGFVLLIVCASVANLTLARMVRREREIAIRSALGAGRVPTPSTALDRKHAACADRRRSGYRACGVGRRPVGRVRGALHPSSGGDRYRQVRAPLHLAIGFQVIVPQQMVGGTGVGDTGATAYAQAMGIPKEQFLARFGAPMPPENSVRRW